jgi:hypothetical protein
VNFRTVRGSAPIDERITLDTYVFGFAVLFPGFQRRPEELQSGAASNVHGPSTGVLEAVAAHRESARSTFGLHDCASDAVGMAEEIAHNDSVVAANHVDARPPTCTPALYLAVLHSEILHPRELDAIVVTPGPHVTHLQSTQDQVLRGFFERAAIVDVQSIHGHVADHQVVQFDETRSGKVEAGTATLNHRRIAWISGGDHDGMIGLTT